MKKLTIARAEWEYATIRLHGFKPIAVDYDEHSEAGMRADTIEVLDRVPGGEVSLLHLLNTLGEEGWEVGATISEATGETMLIIQRQGIRRQQKDARLNAEVIKTLEELGL